MGPPKRELVTAMSKTTAMCVKKILNKVKRLRFDGAWENGWLSFTIIAPGTSYNGRTFTVKPASTCKGIIKNAIKALKRIKKGKAQ